MIETEAGKETLNERGWVKVREISRFQEIYGGICWMDDPGGNIYL